MTRLLLAGLLMVTCAACAGKEGKWTPNWNWPKQVIEDRAAWKDATGRNPQYRDGASPHFW